jgi:hypothetical protein
MVTGLLLVTAMTGAAFASSGSGAPVHAKTCVTTADRNCASEPTRLRSGGKARIRAIRWDDWGGRYAIGYGQLTVTDPKGGGFRTKARVRLYQRQRCNGKSWYTRLTVRYGRDYKTVYTRYAPRVICGRYPPGPNDR